MKDSLKYVPLYGYAFGMHSTTFVQRDGTYNGTSMKKVLHKLNKRFLDRFEYLICFRYFLLCGPFSLKF